MARIWLESVESSVFRVEQAETQWTSYPAGIANRRLSVSGLKSRNVKWPVLPGVEVKTDYSFTVILLQDVYCSFYPVFRNFVVIDTVLNK